MKPRGLATLIVASLLVLVLVGLEGWNSWRRHQMEQIPAGASKEEVLRRLGKPGAGVNWASLRGCGGTECWTYKLIGEDYLSVCFDASGKVVCHESFSIWY